MHESNNSRTRTPGISRESVRWDILSVVPVHGIKPQSAQLAIMSKRTNAGQAVPVVCFVVSKLVSSSRCVILLHIVALNECDCISFSALRFKIKKERMEEKLRLARLSQRLRLQDEGRGRLNHLYKKILTALHRQRKVGLQYSATLYTKLVVTTPFCSRHRHE